MVAGGRRDEARGPHHTRASQAGPPRSAGKLELHTADGDETVVELEALRDNESSIAAVEAARLELRERTAGGREVYLEVPKDERGFGVGRIRIGLVRTPEVLVRISCPEEAGVDIETGRPTSRRAAGSAPRRSPARQVDVEFEEILGEASIATASGDIELGRIDGRARINPRPVT